MTSRQPKKQRKILYEANFNRVRKNLGAHLSKELMEKYKKRSIVVHTGDTVKIMRGKFTGKTGKVEKVNTRSCQIFVEGLQIQKANGQKSKVSIHPSNVIITELNLNDKIRKEIIIREKTNIKGTTAKKIKQENKKTVEQGDKK